jgi:hypothetical protein
VNGSEYDIPIIIMAIIQPEEMSILFAVAWCFFVIAVLDIMYFGFNKNKIEKIQRI